MYKQAIVGKSAVMFIEDTEDCGRMAGYVMSYGVTRNMVATAIYLWCNTGMNRNELHEVLEVIEEAYNRGQPSRNQADRTDRSDL